MSNPDGFQVNIITAFNRTRSTLTKNLLTVVYHVNQTSSSYIFIGPIIFLKHLNVQCFAALISSYSHWFAKINFYGELSIIRGYCFSGRYELSILQHVPCFEGSQFSTLVIVMFSSDLGKCSSQRLAVLVHSLLIKIRNISRAHFCVMLCFCVKWWS